MSEHAEGWFTGAAGRSIYWQSGLPDGQAVGVVVVLHGYAEHSGRYPPVAAALHAAGYAVYALDPHGHRRSDGPRANIASFAGGFLDTHPLVSQAAAAHDGSAGLLLRAAMGGL